MKQEINVTRNKDEIVITKDSNNKKFEITFKVSDFQQLKLKEQDVIALRYGLADNIPRTLNEVGNIFGITRERVRQIEAQAFSKLRFIKKHPMLKVI